MLQWRVDLGSDNTAPKPESALKWDSSTAVDTGTAYTFLGKMSSVRIILILALPLAPVSVDIVLVRGMSKA